LMNRCCYNWHIKTTSIHQHSPLLVYSMLIVADSEKKGQIA